VAANAVAEETLMFLENSRYRNLAQATVPAAGGRSVRALTLRVLPPQAGEPHQVTDSDRLDLLAHERLGDATQFWRIADANTALDATGLTAETGAGIQVPKAP